jgi:hypothetical protein
MILKQPADQNIFLFLSKAIWVVEVGLDFLIHIDMCTTRRTQNSKRSECNNLKYNFVHNAVTGKKIEESVAMSSRGTRRVYPPLST